MPSVRQLLLRKETVTGGLITAAVVSLVWALARTGVWPPWVTVWDRLGRWWPAVARVALALATLGLWRRGRPQASATPGEGRWTKVTAMVTALTAMAALVFTGLSLRASRDQVAVTEQGQLTERYTKAIDQVGAPGADRVWVRAGGIFALERIALDSPRDQHAIVEVLSAFIRTTGTARLARPHAREHPRTSKRPSSC